MYFLGFCSDLYPIIRLIKIAVGVIQYGVPFILILFVTIDFVRAVIAQKEDEMEKFKTIALKRILYAFAVFLVIAIVKIIMSFLADLEVEDLGGALNSQSWISCWECKNKSECKAKDGDDEENSSGGSGSGATGVCCANASNGKQTYTWYDDRSTCVNSYKVDKSKSSCSGTVSADGVCCVKTSSDRKEYQWYPSSAVCSSGWTIDSSRSKDSCKGTVYGDFSGKGVCCAISQSNGTQKFQWYDSTSCPQGFSVDKSKSSCSGTTSASSKGVCCEKNGKNTWKTNSSVCPSGYKVVSGIGSQKDCTKG